MNSATVVGLWRYPVKSMGGEACVTAQVGSRGMFGDRAYALVDTATGKIASAKNPQLWGPLLACAARYIEPPGENGRAAHVEVSLPDGTRVRSSENGAERQLSACIGRSIRLSSAPPPRPILEQYWPDIDDMPHRDALTDERMAAQTFFDSARVHVLTTNALAALRAACPAGSFDVGRFRPNILVESDGGGAYTEDAWIGSEVAIGDEVVLRISSSTPRCVMMTLARPGVGADLDTLRAVAQHHGGSVGVYAEVVRGGEIGLGDAVARRS